MKTNVIILRGPIGVGKSTIARELKNELGDNWVHIDIDKIKQIISSDSSETRTTIAFDVAFYFIEQLIKNNYNLILEEMFRDQHLNSLMTLLNKYNPNIKSFFLTAPLETTINRDRTRTEKTKGEDVISEIYPQVKMTESDIKIDTSMQTIEETIHLILGHLN